MVDIERGIHCNQADCHQFDFLPFTCKKCGLIFCLEHRDYSSHSCAADHDENIVPQCPMCMAHIGIKVGEDPDDKVNQHISRGCEAAYGVIAKPQKTRCTMKGCSTTEILPVHCKNCKKKFCVRHRHPEDHECPHHAQMVARREKQRIQREQEEKARARGDKKMSFLARIRAAQTKPTDRTGLKKAQRRNKSNSRMQAMRQKNSAVGNKNVLESERFYLEVEFSKELNKKAVSMWFNQRHTIGRILDDICTLASVTNRNNVKDARKLCLCTRATMSAFPMDVALQLLEPELSNGQTVVLLYQDTLESDSS